MAQLSITTGKELEETATNNLLRILILISYTVVIALGAGLLRNRTRPLTISAAVLCCLALLIEIKAASDVRSANERQPKAAPKAAASPAFDDDSINFDLLHV